VSDDVTPPYRAPVDPADLEQLRSAVAADRAIAVASIGRGGDAGAIPLLVDALEDPDVDVLFEAARALARIGSAEAVDGLLEKLLDERSFVLRRVVVAGALGRVSAIPDRAVRALHGLLGASDPWLKQAAHESLVHQVRY
jgi:HEAT repeat protein